MKAIPVIILIVLLAGCDNFGSITDSEYVKRAQVYLNKGEFKSATIELKNALAQNPKNTQARLLLGNQYLDAGNMPGAEKELRKAWELGVSDESILPLLARAYLAQGKYDEVQALPELQSSASKKAQASILTSQGIASLRQGDNNSASESIGAALRLKQDMPYALYGQAAVLSIGNRDLEKARKSLNQALKYDPEYAPAWGMLGDLEIQDNNLELASQAYSKAIENSSHSFGYRLKRALVRIRLRQFDIAQQDIDILKKGSPNHPGVNIAQGLLSFLQREYLEAQKSFELALRVNDKLLTAVLYLGLTHAALNNKEQAKSYLSQYISAYPDNLLVRKILAIQELEQQNYREIEGLIRPVISGSSDDTVALNLMVIALTAEGKTDEGIKILERVAKLQPESASAKTRLGIGQLIQGEQADAVTSFGSAIGLDPKSQQADILLVMNYLRKKEYDQAELAAQNLIVRQPDNPVAHNLLGLVYMGKKQPKQARAAFTKAIEMAPGNLIASLNLAALAIKDSKPDEARKLYQQVLEKHENNLQTLLKLAVLEGLQNNIIAMRATLERAIKAHPNAFQPRVILARIFLRENNVTRASDVMGLLGNTHPNNPSVLSALAEIELANKDYKKAKITLEKLVERQPKSAQAHYLLAQAYAGLDERAKTEQELARALKLQPRHYPALIAQTRLQLLNQKFKEAEKNLDILKDAAVDNPDVLDIEAALKAQSGDKTQALSILEHRFQISPTTKSLLALARFNWSLGKRQEAVGAIEQWVVAHPDDIAALNALADAYIVQKRHNDAITQYEKILEISESNTQALNNLAWLLRKTDPDRALNYAAKAYAISPKSPGIMDTLSGLLLARGELVRAERLNERALEKNPESPTFLFRKAKILEAMKKKDEAVVVLMKILGDKKTFPERDEAEAMLKRLGG